LRTAVGQYDVQGTKFKALKVNVAARIRKDPVYSFKSTNVVIEK